MNRCLNDLFGYCYDKPQPKKVHYDKVTFDYRGQPHHDDTVVLKCRNNPYICSYYLTQTKLHTLLTK